MANLEGMPISSLPVADSIQDGDELVLYRPSTGKAYQTTGVMDEIKANTDLIDNLSGVRVTTKLNSCDDYTTTGTYYFTGTYVPDDIPAGTNGWLIVLHTNSGYIKQFWLRMGTPGTNDYMTYTRAYNSASGWGAWSALASIEAGTAVGSSNVPVYVNANGRIQSCGFDYSDITDLIDSLSNGAGGLAFTVTSGSVLDYVEANCTNAGMYIIYFTSTTDMPVSGPYVCLIVATTETTCIVFASRPGSTQYNYQNNRLTGTWQGWYRYTGTAVS